MARLLKKIPNDLKDLEFTWSSRDEFITHITADPNFLVKIKIALPNTSQLIKTDRDVARHMFLPTGWQLTAFGCAMLMGTYKPYKIAGPSRNNLTGRIIVKMNQLVNGPWYLSKESLYVWDKNVSFEVQIFGSDLNTYINAYFAK